MKAIAARAIRSTKVEDMLWVIVVNRMSAGWDGEVEFGTMVS